MIDWDFAGPVDPRFELAHVCWLNARLHDDTVAENEGLPSPVERARHLRAIVEGYGMPKRGRRDLVRQMIEVAILESAAEADIADIRLETAAKDLADQVPWAIAWRARAAAWMIRNRPVLENALI